VLQRAGAQVFRSLRDRGEVSEGSVLETLERLRDIEQRAATVGAALEQSLATDRRDFAGASDLARWAVVGRGVLERVVLRERARRAQRERAELERELGRTAFDGAHPELRRHLPDADASELAAARSEVDAAAVLEKHLCEPYGGEPLPAWLRSVLNETRSFFRHVWKQLSSRLFLRAPAIAGLFAGWWIARTFTDSALESLLHDVGLGGRRGISATTMSWLSFWLPLVAAALCSYLGAFVATRVQRRYAPRENEPKAQSSVERAL
jgi:hypothetical protein